jgi:hypothetical protein
MAQTNPSYSSATGKSEKPIIDELIKKYGFSNVTWPIVLMENDKTIAYVYENNRKNTLNLEMDSRPGSKTHLLSYYLNYVKSPRELLPQEAFLQPFLKPGYSCSYDYILSLENSENSNFKTVDLDYVWYNGSNYKGFEMTTFWVDFSSHARALELIKKMNRRPSWQGPDGAHAFHKIVDSASDLGVDYYLVCANTVSKVGSELKTNGNVCVFQLTHRQVDLIQNGYPPENSRFMTFADFLKWL